MPDRYDSGYYNEADSRAVRFFCIFLGQYNNIGNQQTANTICILHKETEGQ